jgi:RNA polymerase sigma-70 factor (ECF subfamily)
VQDEPGRDLLQRFVHGDRDAFELLFRQFEREVHRWIMRIVREPAAADDALIDAFWRAYRSRARFDPSRSFGAWMRRIGTHAAIDQVNAARRRRWVSLDDAGVTRSNRDQIEGRRRSSLEDVGRVPPSHDHMRGGPGDAEVIAHAFRCLPAKLQVVATLALIEERPHAEIAEALDVPIGTVKSRLFRATRLLRKELARLGVHT